jgi:hypothetical protein
MAHGRDKYQSRENQQRVRRVLNEHWDPIGVIVNPDLDDEYDSYVGTVCVMLMDHEASEAAISRYLYETATGHIGMPRAKWLLGRCEETAAILVSLRPEFRSH